MTIEPLSLYKYKRSRKCNKVADISKGHIKNTNHGNVTTNSTQTLGGGNIYIYLIFRCGINKNKLIVIKMLKVQTRRIKETET